MPMIIPHFIGQSANPIPITRLNVHAVDVTKDYRNPKDLCWAPVSP